MKWHYCLFSSFFFASFVNNISSGTRTTMSLGSMGRYKHKATTISQNNSQNLTADCQNLIHSVALKNQFSRNGACPR
jgi:hypothetical protein